MEATPNTPPRRRILTRIARRPLLILPVVGIALAGALGGLASPAKSVAPATASEGLICDWGTLSGSSDRTFALTAKSGSISTADGNQVPMWGYASDDGAYQYPSPFLCVTEGETIHVVLNNALRLTDGTPVATSIMFPGQQDVTANGVAAQPVFNGTGPSGGLQSLVQSVDTGGTITYSFVAGKPGSYLYMSGTDTAVQEQMGLFGGLVVHSATVANAAPTIFGGAIYPADPSLGGNRLDSYGREYAHMLSEVDPDMHIAKIKGEYFDMTQYRPRYWFVNGRGFPDTIAPNDAEWLPSQPYSSLVHVMPYDPAAGGVQDTADNRASDNLPVAIRYFNASTVPHPFHPHAADTDILGIDAEPQIAGNVRVDMLKYLLEIAPGQTMDAVWNWKLLTHPDGTTNADSIWDPATHPVPVPVQDNRDTRYTPESWYGGTPYLGTTDDLTLGVTQLNECGEYYHVAHSHAVNEATTYGAAGGGMLTLYRIDPPNHWNCK